MECPPRLLHRYRLETNCPCQWSLFGDVGLVMDVDGDPRPFLEAKQRPGKLAVVRGDGKNAIGSHFQRLGGYGQCVVGRGLAQKAGRRKQSKARSGSSGLQEISTRTRPR